MPNKIVVAINYNAMEEWCTPNKIVVAINYDSMEKMIYCGIISTI